MHLSANDILVLILTNERLFFKPLGGVFSSSISSLSSSISFFYSSFSFSHDSRSSTSSLILAHRAAPRNKVMFGYETKKMQMTRIISYWSVISLISNSRPGWWRHFLLWQIWIGQSPFSLVTCSAVYHENRLQRVLPMICRAVVAKKKGGTVKSSQYLQWRILSVTSLIFLNWSSEICCESI